MVTLAPDVAIVLLGALTHSRAMVPLEAVSPIRRKLFYYEPKVLEQRFSAVHIINGNDMYYCMTLGAHYSWYKLDKPEVSCLDLHLFL